MLSRSFCAPDLPELIDLTIRTFRPFRPFHEDYVRDLFGDELFAHQHGHWEQDYRDQVPTLHDPARGRHVAVAEIDDEIVGDVAWGPDRRPASGEIGILAVVSGHRRDQIGRRLCIEAIDHMRGQGISVVGIGTGDDAFHTAARGLYESLGFTKVPTAGYLRRI